MREGEGKKIYHTERRVMTRKEAIEIIRKNLQCDQDVIPDFCIESPTGWILSVNSKDYIKTRDIGDLIFGQGYHLVLKETSKVYEFNSGFTFGNSIEDIFNIYELGFLEHQEWEIEIVNINNMIKTIKTLSQIGVEYTSTERVSQTDWNIPQKYDFFQIWHRLQHMPGTFYIGELVSKWRTIASLAEQDDFEYRLRKARGKEKLSRAKDWNTTFLFQNIRKKIGW